jgi:DNA-binding NarL/FixJ family response regulator
MKKDVITFILVDDHPVVRDGMEAMLLSEEDFESFGTAADADEAITLVRAKPPDVVLTDVRMPKGDGFQLLTALRAEFPKVQVIMLAGSPLSAERDEAKEAGARGYVSKSVQLEKLVDMVRLVVSDPQAFVEDVSDEAPTILSAREIQVLKAFAAGKTREEVAAELGVGTETVKTHTRLIMKKLDVPNTLSAVTTALRLGLIR